MTILSKLANAQEGRGEGRNIELAKTIALAGDEAAVNELVKNLSNKKREIQNDCIKTLYEIGERKPALIADYYEDFIQLLDSKNQRLIWGAITALSKITLQQPEAIYEALPQILEAVDKTQSVIARDHTVYILAELSTVERYNEAFELLIEIIMKAPVNQLAMYAEKAGEVATKSNKSILSEALICRLEDLEQEPKRKRIEKVLKKLEKIS